MDGMDIIGDLFKTISDVERILLFEACNDGDKDSLLDWLNSEANKKKKSPSFNHG